MGSGATCTTDAERAVATNWAYDSSTDTNAGKLDECNGRWTVTPEFPSGMYVYALNVDASGKPDFPGVPYCKHGSAGIVFIDAARGRSSFSWFSLFLQMAFTGSLAQST